MRLNGAAFGLAGCGWLRALVDIALTSREALRVADSNDLIRVKGGRENNLKDVSAEMLKRRLTVFTGVSGWGKNSPAFGTIAAQSQRLINHGQGPKLLCADLQ